MRAISRLSPEARVLYLGVRCWRTICETLAMTSSSACRRRRGAAVPGEGHAQRLQQGERLLVGGGGGGDRDVHAPHLIDLVVVDLGEDDLLAHPQRVVAAAVEGPRVEPA